MAGPPSYQAAAYRQLWIIIAPYVQAHSLYSTCLVCQQWNSIFTPILWGDPASVFGTDSDTIYLSLTRFKRRLSRVRLEVRSLVHTLHIPPAQPQLYDGPQAGWFRDILDRLPSLQALIVSSLSFFDHRSLQTFHQSKEQSLARYPLRLLVASNCENTTPSSLCTAISHFPDLLYLDLSAAHGSRNPQVLRQIGTLSELRVLKLHSSGLRDEDLDSLVLPERVRSLDVSRNLLTEKSIENLIARLPMSNIPYRRSIDARRYSGVPLPIRVLDEGVDSFVLRHLTSGVEGHLRIEEGLPQNFTHLYVSSNYLSIDGVTRILKYPSLQHLDCGTLNLSQRPFELLSPRSLASPTRKLSDPGEEQILSPLLFADAFHNLRCLRIHHSVITAAPFSSKEEVATSNLCFELPSEDLRFELDSRELLTAPIFFELEDTSAARFELPDADRPENNADEGPAKDSPEVADEPPEQFELEFHARYECPDDVGGDLSPVSPISPIDIKQFDRFPSLTLNGNSSHHIPRKEVPLRLSVSESPTHIISEQSSLPTPSVPEGPRMFKYNYTSGPERSWCETLPLHQKARTIKQIIDESSLRRHRISVRERDPGRFQPLLLPNLKHLTLTDIPSSTRRNTIPESLCIFIQELAEEEEMARLEYLRLYQEESEIPDYSHLVDGTLKLHQLVLEIISNSSPFCMDREQRLSFSKSATEDYDSEMFIHASESDFSFFGEDDGGLLVSEGRLDGKMRVDDGLILEARGGEGRLVDVVGELVSFRRERRRAWEQARREGLGGVEQALVGFWRGSVKVVKEAQ